MGDRTTLTGTLGQFWHESFLRAARIAQSLRSSRRPDRFCGPIGNSQPGRARFSEWLRTFRTGGEFVGGTADRDVGGSILGAISELSAEENTSDLSQQSLRLPEALIRIDCLPGRIIVWQHSPGTTSRPSVINGIDDFTK